MRRLLFLLSFLLLGQFCWAEASERGTRAILLIWDTKDDQQAEAYLTLIKELKALREGGSFSQVAGLASSFKVYDFNQKSHAQAILSRKLAQRQDTPFLAVVRLGADGTPAQVLWSRKATDPTLALDALQSYLGLEPVQPLPASGWEKQGSRWVHADGLSIACPAQWVGTPSATGLELQDPETGAQIGLRAVVGEAKRLESVIGLHQALHEQNPNLQLGPPQLAQIASGVPGHKIEVYRQFAKNPLPTRLSMGSISWEQRSLVFVATEPTGPLAEQCARALEQVLASLRYRPGKRS